jgi:hypothetical protein
MWDNIPRVQSPSGGFRGNLPLRMCQRDFSEQLLRSYQASTHARTKPQRASRFSLSSPQFTCHVSQTLSSFVAFNEVVTPSS